MALTLDQLIANLEALQRDLPAIAAERMAVAAEDAVQLQIERMQERGKGSDGRNLKKYSKNKLPSFFFTNAKDKPLSKARAKTFKGGISYEEYRKAVGLPTDKVTLTRTGEMLRNIGVIGAGAQGSSFLVRIGFRRDAMRERMGHVLEQRPNAFGFTKGERTKLRKNFTRGMLRIINQRIRSK